MNHYVLRVHYAAHPQICIGIENTVSKRARAVARYGSDKVQLCMGSSEKPDEGAPSRGRTTTSGYVSECL